MNSALKHANFQIPEDLLNQLRETVGKGESSSLSVRCLEDYRRTIKSHHLKLDDCFIAATCASNKAALITANSKQYPMRDVMKKDQL